MQKNCSNKINIVLLLSRQTAKEEVFLLNAVAMTGSVPRNVCLV